MKARYLGTDSRENGRTTAEIECAVDGCRYTWDVAVWSASGHGFIRCPECKTEYRWPSLECIRLAILKGPGE
jgi:hypothetical protein